MSLVLGFVAKQRFQRWSWFAAIAMLVTILPAVVVYIRCIGSDRHCRSLPAARRYPPDARFYRCVLIDRPEGWVDLSAVVVITGSQIELCERWSHLRVLWSVSHAEVAAISTVRARTPWARFAEITAGTDSRRIRTSAATVRVLAEAIEGRA
jgi:hypothetical protein